jgi:hypothetical protein
MICCMLTGRYIPDAEELLRALNEKHISRELIKLVVFMCRINPDERPNAKDVNEVLRLCQRKFKIQIIESVETSAPT